MTTTRKRSNTVYRPGEGWAWAIQDTQDMHGRHSCWLLCCWAHPLREMVTAEPKPSPEAKCVRVRIVKA